MLFSGFVDDSRHAWERCCFSLLNQFHDSNEIRLQSNLIGCDAQIRTSVLLQSFSVRRRRLIKDRMTDTVRTILDRNAFVECLDFSLLMETRDERGHRCFTL